MAKKKQVAPPPRPVKSETDDVVVPIGSMASSKCDSVKLDSNYEEMVEDVIGNFNHFVTQGVDPMTALFAMISGASIVFGCAVRAGLPQAECGKLMYMMGKNTAAASKMVQIQQNQTVSQAVGDVLKASKRKVN